MKFALHGLLLIIGLCAATAWSENSIEGHWRFTSYIYQGKERPPLNPNLVLIFEFNRDGTSRLFWYREGERGFCERSGQYSWTEGFLKERVTWVNPNNDSSCARDPDMQLGRETITRLEHHGSQLRLFLGIADEPFIYVLRPACFSSNS